MKFVKSTHCGASNTCVELAWRKSEHCTADANCVETAHNDGTVHIRDSKFKDMPHIQLNSGEYRNLLETLKAL